MDSDYYYLNLNAVDWRLWTRLHELTEPDADPEALTRFLCSWIPPTLLDADMAEQRRAVAAIAAAEIDIISPILQPQYAAFGMWSEPARFGPILAALLRDPPDGPCDLVRREIMQLAFVDGGHRQWGYVQILRPLDLLGALVPPFRDELCGRLPPARGDLLWGAREATEDDLSPRAGTALYEQPIARAMGVVLPVLPIPFCPVESRSWAPADVAELVAQLEGNGATRSGCDAIEDREFFTMVDEARRARAGSDVASSIEELLERDLAEIAQAFRGSAERGLGMDAHYTARP